MTILVHSVTYQDYPCKAVRWGRSDGLEPGMGWVIVDYAVLKDLKLEVAAVAWTGDDGGADVPGGLGIFDWWELFGKRPGTRTADKPFSPPGSGLKLSGPLIFRTSTEGGGAVETARFDGVYCVNAEEVAKNLARAREHKEGEIRIDIADVRWFYQKYGTIIGRINCRRENGSYDPRTIKVPGSRIARGGTTTASERDGTPWSFEEVMRYLFSQLPGSPSVNLTGLTNMPPPEEINHVGSNAAAVLDALLDNFGLVPKMQPNGTYFVARKNAKFLTRGQISRAVGKAESPTHIAYEVKSASRIDTPAVVMVLGGNRYRAQTLGYVPVFRDVDGKLYRLSDIAKVFDGYTIDQVNAQAAKTPSKHFQDVPPQPFKGSVSRGVVTSRLGAPGTVQGQAQDTLHYARRRILREQAYRLYAPMLLFEGKAPTNAKGAPYFSDLDDATFEFLPMGPVPVLESKLPEILAKGGAKKVRGDKGRVILAPPIVRGAMLGEALYTDNGEIAAQHNAKIHGWELCVDVANVHLATAKFRLLHLFEEALGADAQAAVAEFIESSLIQKLTGSQTVFSRPFLERARKANKYIDGQAALLLIELQVQEARVKSIEEKIKELEKNRATDFAALQLAGGVQGVEQVPFGVIPENAYSLESATGILIFDKPCCMVDHALVFDQEDLTVLFDGMVSVTFGHPVDNNEPSDFTSVLFMADGNGGSKLCGVSRPSAVKPYVVRDSDIVLYEDEEVQALNLKDCVAQAERKAKPVLDGANTTEGFVTQFSGFVPCVLERGVNSVQFEWDGGAAYTYVAVHSPGWIGPARQAG